MFPLRIAAFFVILNLAPATAQSVSGDLTGRLVGKPLYLRGFWSDDRLAFDAEGQLVGKSAPGAVTLSGMDVRSAVVHGKQLVLTGNRVALIASAAGEPYALVRRPITSTTLVYGAILPKTRHFKTTQEMKITVQAGADGRFDAALQGIFDDGLAQLANDVPPPWQCFAESFFKPAHVSDQALDDVRACVQRPAPETAPYSEGCYTPAAIETLHPFANDPVAAELGAFGHAMAHVRVLPNGTPVGFQVVRAVGAGIDENLLVSLSQSTYQPATRDGRPVPGDVAVDIQVGPAPQ